MIESYKLLLSLIILFLPLAGFGIIIFFGRIIPKVHRVGVFSLFINLVLSIALLVEVVFIGHGNVSVFEFNWISLNTLSIDFGIMLDNYTVVMLFVVNLISFLVHLYSIEYMKGDSRFNRYFAYLGLFTFSMLGIVFTHNILMMYIFWELVGLSSYLLIGFWFEKDSAANAAKKAFLVNRIGDIGMFLGILILFVTYNTFTFSSIFEQIGMGTLPFGSEFWLSVGGVLIFMGAVGKSAQFPLHVWLPDAMEGPTPVSALIHAATMVAAGVYMLVRVFPLLTADALLVIAVIGAFTAFLAATMALTANDIKKILAYSTISQLGYMVMAIGTGFYYIAFFHLVTHAFFKAGLFLGSGSVITAMHHEQNIWKMGGLRKKMPITFATFLISTLALSGVPFTSGFLSKDGILAGTFAFGQLTGHWIIPLLGFASAFLTAFYMFRLVFVAFINKPADEYSYEHAKESPFLMTLPLMVLAALSIFFWYSFNPFDANHGVFLHDIATRFTQVLPESLRYGFSTTGFELSHHEITAEAFEHAMHGAHIPAMVTSIILAFSAIILAWFFYHKKPEIPELLRHKMTMLHKTLSAKWYIDEIYESVFVNNLLRVSKFFSAFDRIVVDGIVNGTAFITRIIASISGIFDVYIVDGLVNFAAFISGFVGMTFKRIQTGRVQTYLIYALFSILILIIIFK